MFAPQQTGYSGNSSEGGPAAKSIVELIGGSFGSE